jgi:ATP-dependent helicase/nuclease subunit A
VADETVRAYEDGVRRIKETALPPFVSPSGLETSLGEERPVEPETGSSPGCPAPGNLARAAGVLVHRLLETWDRGTPKSLREGLRALSRSVAFQEGVDPAALETEAAEILDRFSRSDLVERFRKLDIVDRELPLLLRAESGAAFRGVIDLLYRDPDGSIVVADYKTGREEDEEALRRRYAPQLQVYAEAVRAALELGELPRAELWHLRSGRRIRV